MHETPTPELPRFFPAIRTRPCYAVYATALDRFLLVDSNDLSILLRAVMLFSSKIVCVVCVYDHKINPALSNSTCLAWAPKLRVSQAKSRIPTVLRLPGRNAIIEKGPPAFADAGAVARAQAYLMFTVKVTYAQFMTNARLSHADIRMFHHMIPKFETLPGAALSVGPEIFPAQVRDQRIEEILYFADSLAQATAELDALLAKPLGSDGSPSRYRVEFDQFLDELDIHP
jgi:hypothetical protein